MRRFASRIISAALVATVAIVAAELMSRIDDAVRMGTPLLASPAYADLMMHDSLGIRGRPRAHYQKWRMNSAGFRGVEITTVPRPNCVRVAVIGASETFGYYESPGKEFPAQLADSLGKHGCYEVINAALAGMSVPAQIQLWENWLSRFRPSVVVIYVPPAFYLGDDPPDFAPPTAGGPSTIQTRFASRLLDRLRDRIEYPAFIQRRRVANSIARAVVGKPDTWFYRDVPRDRLALFRSHLDSLVSSVQAKGALPVLVTHAMRFGNPPAQADADLLRSWRKFTPRATEAALLDFERTAGVSTRELAQARGIPVVDVARVMTGHSKWFADFTHFNDNGSGVVAGAIARTVERGGWRVDTTR
ncbi:MAG TPA: hypothetical protein VGO33_14985 [Gemmatimonadaceae bacterium]|jgi:hypothetical protein|nr:hypothetical protein [Gemmatimonadaceae bacterium]